MSHAEVAEEAEANGERHDNGLSHAEDADDAEKARMPAKRRRALSVLLSVTSA